MLHAKNELTTSPDTQATENPFSLLPDELVCQIFQKIDERQNEYHDLDIVPQSQRDLKSLCLVDKRFYKIATDILWCAPLLKTFDVDDFQVISKKPIKHISLEKFQAKTAEDEPSRRKELFEMLASMESLTSLSSSTTLLLSESCLSLMTNLRSLIVTGLLTGTTIAKVLSPDILKCDRLQTLVLDKVDVFNDLFKMHKLEVPDDERDEDAALQKMFSALSELKNLRELRITLSPYVSGESNQKLKRCCNTYKEDHPSVKVQIVSFHDLMWDAFVASGKLAASEKRAREDISNQFSAYDAIFIDSIDGIESNEEYYSDHSVDHYSDHDYSDDDL